MVVDEVVNATTNTVIGDVVVELGKFGLLLQTLGMVIILWIVFQIVIFTIERRKRNRLKRIEERLSNIEKKLDRVLKKK